MESKFTGQKLDTVATANIFKLFMRSSEVNTVAIIGGDLYLSGENVKCDMPNELYSEICAQLDQGQDFLKLEYEFAESE